MVPLLHFTYYGNPLHFTVQFGFCQQLALIFLLVDWITFVFETHFIVSGPLPIKLFECSFSGELHECSKLSMFSLFLLNSLLPVNCSCCLQMYNSRDRSIEQHKFVLSSSGIKLIWLDRLYPKYIDRHALCFLVRWSLEQS
ncbi:unnamed protein product [Linum tenue]|uniref:Uncharacterized protein n=1 Tax=Linum tenue TaxID=586396 RepID=A0AAV0NEP4_9ROSI|nr:unnamed protein product [Linum tenue]CAI0456912.1 unnamed protein product [Linum tenue]